MLAVIEEHDVARVGRLLGAAGGDGEVPAYLARKALAERLRWSVSDTGEALTNVAAGAPARAGLEVHVACARRCRRSSHVPRWAR